MTEQKTKQKTVQKTAPKKDKVTTGVVHAMKSVVHKTGRWLWDHKKPILANAAWLGVGTMLGAVRVIPPPAKFVKLGLFRIGT